MLILSASVGAGHVRAGQAVELALRQTDPTLHVEHVDVLQLTNGLFRRFYAKGYFDMVEAAPAHGRLLLRPVRQAEQGPAYFHGSRPDAVSATEPAAAGAALLQPVPPHADTYGVAYDICDPKRLRRVARVCEDFGARRQYSVFFCRLPPHDLVHLKARLWDILNLEEDQVLFIPLCVRCGDPPPLATHVASAWRANDSADTAARRSRQHYYQA